MRVHAVGDASRYRGVGLGARPGTRNDWLMPWYWGVLDGRGVAVPQAARERVLELLHLRLDVGVEVERLLEHVVEVDAVSGQDDVLRHGVGAADERAGEEVVQVRVPHAVYVEHERVELALALGAIRPPEVGAGRHERPVHVLELGEGFGEGVLEHDLAVHPAALAAAVADYERVRLEPARFLTLALNRALPEPEQVGVEVHGLLGDASPLLDDLGQHGEPPKREKVAKEKRTDRTGDVLHRSAP